MQDGTAVIDAPIQPGMLVEIAPGLRRLTANNPSPMTGPGTNSYIVGRGACLIVDPGVDDETHLEALMAACDGHVCGICLTHRHPDHVGGTARLAQWSGAPVLAWPKPELSSHDKAVHVNHELSDHELLGDGLLKVHHTPGHAADHVAFEWLDQGILLAGDALMTDATVVILPPVKLLISPGYTFAMGAGDWLVYAACFAVGAALAWALGKVQGKE